MKFLPDSMILGTAGRVRHMANKSAKNSKPIEPADSRVFKGRSVAELLELAGIDPKTRQEAGK